MEIRLVTENSDMVSSIQTWCLILCLVSAWWSLLYGMFVCPFLTSATSVFRISNWFLFVYLAKMLLYLPQINSEQTEWGSWVRKPGLTHIRGSMTVIPTRLFTLDSKSLCIIKNKIVQKNGRKTERKKTGLQPTHIFSYTNQQRWCDIFIIIITNIREWLKFA